MNKRGFSLEFQLATTVPPLLRTCINTLFYCESSGSLIASGYGLTRSGLIIHPGVEVLRLVERL